MVIDKRTQERIITIKIEQKGYHANVDDLVDKIVEWIKIFDWWDSEKNELEHTKITLELT